MRYTYTATTKEGKTIKGTAEAANKEALIATLTKQGVKPIVISIDNKTGTNRARRGKVKLKDLVVFTRQLSTMISAGVPLTRGLSTLQEQTENKYFREVIGGITKDVEGGIALGDSLAKYPRVFSDVYVNMVRAGEAGGILDEILKRLASQVEQDASMRKKIKSASMYPTVIFGITILSFFGIMMFVIPKLGAIIKDMGGEDARLPIYTEIMLSGSEFMQQNAVFIFLLLGVVGYFTRRYIRTPKGKYQFHALLLKIPVIKVLLIKIAIARFARTFASLMSAGVSVLDALEVVAIETTIAASARLFVQSEQSNVPTVLIDLGSLSSDLTIYDKELIVTGTVPGGGDSFTNAIAKKLDVSPQEAHIIKTKYGLGLSKKQTDLVECLTPILDQLTKEVKRMVRYYQERSGSDDKIRQIVTMGGGANMPGLSEHLTSSLRIPVRMCDPWRKLDFAGLQHPNNTEKSMYITVAGLALINPKEIFRP